MVGGSLGVVTVGCSVNIEMMIACRSISGFFAGSLVSSQAAMTDISTSENRSGRLGLIGAALGVAQVVGPAMGGPLSSLGLPSVGITSCVVFLGAALCVFVLLPETMPVERRGITRWRKMRAARLGAATSAAGMPGASQEMTSLKRAEEGTTLPAESASERISLLSAQEAGASGKVTETYGATEPLTGAGTQPTRGNDQASELGTAQVAPSVTALPGQESLTPPRAASRTVGLVVGTDDIVYHGPLPAPSPPPTAATLVALPFTASVSPPVTSEQQRLATPVSISPRPSAASRHILDDSHNTLSKVARAILHSPVLLSLYGGYFSYFFVQGSMQSLLAVSLESRFGGGAVALSALWVIQGAAAV